MRVQNPKHKTSGLMYRLRFPLWSQLCNLEKESLRHRVGCKSAFLLCSAENYHFSHREAFSSLDFVLNLEENSVSVLVTKVM